MPCDHATPIPFFPDALIQCARLPRKFAARIPYNTTVGRVSSSLGGETANVIAAALFVRRLRCGRLREFLEARIVPERIEHRIEPEKRGSKRRNLSEKFSLLFRRKRLNDFLKARIGDLVGGRAPRAPRSIYRL